MNDELYSRLAATGRPECPQCGYSLAGLPGPHLCPECGRPYGRDILTWRPRFPIVIVGFSFAIWFAFALYYCWQAGFRPIATVVFGSVTLAFLHFFRTNARAVKRQFVCLDDRGIGFHGGARESQFVEWPTIRELTYNKGAMSVWIHLHDGRRYRFPRAVAPKEVDALLAVANTFARHADVAPEGAE